MTQCDRGSLFKNLEGETRSSVSIDVEFKFAGKEMDAGGIKEERV